LLVLGLELKQGRVVLRLRLTEVVE
jgi:hypothetical protein